MIGQEVKTGVAAAIRDAYQVPLFDKGEKRKKLLSTVSLFSGAGGLDLGLEAAGFSTIFASDIDEHSCRTLKAGKETARLLGKPFFEHSFISDPLDIRHLDAAYIRSTTGYAPGAVDLLAGGPPCQAFSVFGKRLGRQDPRGLLAFEYLRVLTTLRPKAFLLENVSGILTIEDGAVINDLKQRLSNPTSGLYYDVSVLRLNAANYGVPQFRDRVFIIGHAGGKKIESIPSLCANPASEKAELPAWRTVRDALRGLPNIGADYPANHVGRVHSERIRDRYALLSPGERDHFTRINKLDLDKPSFTIIVGSDKGGGKGHVHPTEPREVTPRESARIQTFPDWLAFSGTSRHPIRQVGNAVPPLLAAAVGNQIRKELFGFTAISQSSLVSALGQEHLYER